MDRKRRFPARASARVEQQSKKRNVSTRQRSETPAPPPEPTKEDTPPPPPPPSLPTSVEVGKPLPTVEESQPDDLSTKDYQSVEESGVLTESLARSRQKWISEGLFEKYWTKPHKRKGVLIEDPKNPPKDSMSRVGPVTIIIEPHIIEATMFTVKGPPKPRLPQPEQAQFAGLPQQQQQQQQQYQHQYANQQQQPVQQQQQHRPIIQYGPANGVMPPPAVSSPAVSSPSAMTPTSDLATGPLTPQAGPLVAETVQQATSTIMAPAAAAAEPPVKKSPSPNPSEAPRPPPTATPTTQQTTPIVRPVSNPPAGPAIAPTPQTQAPVTRPPNTPAAVGQAQSSSKAPAATATAQPGAAPKPATNDPVIALLAQKASGDSELRDLMKRVAIGQAKDGELAHFQKIIDQLNAEYKRNGGQQGPSADRLLVDGRTVKYFADEVKTILEVVLASNPNQKSAELRPPAGSDPLVVLVVKTALEDERVRGMIRRIAEGKPGFTDATDLKETLDRLNRDAKALQLNTPTQMPGRQLTPNSVPNGGMRPIQQQHGQQQQQQQQQMQYANHQPIRSKAPPPNRPEVAAVVFDFGTGDRFMFPKYSILEYLPTTSGQQVVASFLIVRKGSVSEYGGDPALDYYQPVTIRLSTPTGRYLENLARVVAHQEEVRRYMDDVMDNMTRAEYVLLAMRLPRPGQDGEEDQESGYEADMDDMKPEFQGDITDEAPSVLWTVKAGTSIIARNVPRSLQPLDLEEEAQEKYQRLVRSTAERNTELV